MINDSGQARFVHCFPYALVLIRLCIHIVRKTNELRSYVA